METHKQVLSAKEMARRIVQRIRNPLNALQLNVDNLENEIGELNIGNRKNIPDHLRRIRNTIGELDSLLSEVLRVANLPRPRITAINVNALVTEVETFARPESSKKEVTVIRSSRKFACL